MLGGLFVKAGFDTFYPHDPATLYGMLLHAKSLINKHPDILNEWKNLGKDLLIGEKEKTENTKKKINVK